MPRLVAFLRAVNIGGRLVKMDALRAEFEALGLTDVQTFIASGNVIFDTRARDHAALERKIEARLAQAFGFEIDTFLRTFDEVSSVAAHASFSDDASPTQVVGFLRSVPTADARKTVAAMSSAVDRLELHGRELIWRSDNRQSESTFSNAAFERALKMRTTFRGVGTLRKLVTTYAK